MPPLANLTRTAWAAQQARPKTALGFFGATVASIVGGVPLTIWALGGAGTTAACVLGAAFLLIVAIMAGVFAIVWKDPTKLQLGQITGSEYTEAQRLTIGDDLTGERVVRRSASGIELADPNTPLGIEDPKEPRP